MWTVKTGYDNGSYYLTTHQSYYYLTMFLALLFCSSTAIVTRRMAIANRTCVSFCNKPKAQYLAISGESRRYVVAFNRFAGGGIWLPQESLRHIFASPVYAPRTIAVNVTWMKGGFNACQTHRSMFPSNSTCKFKSSQF